MGPGRLELPTSRLSSARSNQLSYEPAPSLEIAPIVLGRSPVRGVHGSGKGCAGSGAGFGSARNPGRLNPAILVLPRGAIASGSDFRTGCDDGNFTRRRVCLRSIARGVRAPMEIVLRKEVIQPQVPLRLPCYDFTPVADLTVVGCLLAVGAPA